MQPGVRVTPWVTTGAVLLCAVAAALLSLATAPRYYTQPGHGSQRATRLLRVAVRTTLAQSSFTVTFNRGSVLKFIAPDKTYDISSLVSTVIIGNRIYAPESSTSPRWYEAPLPPQSQQSIFNAALFLSLLTRTADVTQDGDRFFSRSVSPDGTGIAYFVTTVDDDLVVAQNLRLDEEGHVETIEVRYSRFGTTVPPVTLPPTNEIDPAIRCGGSYQNPTVPC